MIEGRPSATARRVAMRRAAHQLVDDPRIFTDPLALAILGPDAEAVLRADRDAMATRGPMRALRAFLAVRSRVADERIAAAVAGGVRQVVVLGAGLDTFAYRHPHGDALRVFEVDHPATQAWKRERLAAAGIAVPPSVTFAPVDFERETLAEALGRAGLDRAQPAFYSWLGVVPYLAREAVTRTLAFVAGSPAGGGIVLDYGTPPERLPLPHRWAFRIIAARVARIGEPWRTFYEPAELAAELRGVGFARIEDDGSAELNSRYFADRRDGMKLYGMAHIATAWV